MRLRYINILDNSYSSVAATTLTGTTGNDILNAPGSVTALVQGQQGNDTITLSLAADEASGGKGNDTMSIVRVGALTNGFTGGEGNDTIFIRSATSYAGTASLGDGADTIRFQNAAGGVLLSGANIAMNGGNDTIAINTGGADTFINAGVGLGQGDDLLSDGGNTAENLVSSTIFGGKGKDTIRLGGANTGSSSVIQGGNGADRIFMTAVNAMAVSNLVAGGRGTDSISFGGVIGSIAGGGLNDTIGFAGNTFASGNAVYGDGVGVITVGTGTEGAADGADVIGNSATVFAGSSTIYGGGSKDTIDVRSMTAGLIHGGNGADSITVFSGGALHRGSIFGGNANDTISVNSAFGRVVTNMTTVNGGAGADNIIIDGVAAGYLTGASRATTNAMAVVAYGAGDVISLASTALTNQTANANWMLGAASVWVATGSLFNTQVFITSIQANGDGSVAAYSDGTDTYISYFANTGNQQVVKITGVDAVLTTRTKQQVTLSASNFGFTLTENNAGTSTGLNITLT